MAEYIPTHKACALLGLTLASSGQLARKHKIRFIKDYNCKFWNMDDIQAILDKRKRLSEPPKGWLTSEQAADMMKYSVRCATTFMKKLGLRPKKIKVFEGRAFQEKIFWNKHEVDAILGEAYRKRKRIAPDGWLTFADVAMYLGVNNKRATFYIRKYKPARRHSSPIHYLYYEDDIVAMRKDINTKKQCRKNKLERTYSEKS